MSRSKFLTVTVITLLVINLGTLAFLIFSRSSHPQSFQGPRHGEGPKQIIIDRLGFDAEQQRAYQLTIDAHRRKTRELEQMSRDLHQQLFALLKDQDYQQRADAFIEQISLNQKAIDHLNFNHFMEIKAICKKEQLPKFNALAGDLARLFAPQGPPH